MLNNFNKDFNKDFNKVDKIILTDKEYIKITKWVQEQNFDGIDLPLNEVFVIIKDVHYHQLNINIDMGIHFKADPNTSNISVTQYYMEDMTPMVTGIVTDDFFKTGKFKTKTEERWRKVLGEDYLQKVCKISILTVMDIFQYMTNYTENIIIKEYTKTVRKPSRHKSKNVKRYTKIKTTQYTFNTDSTTKRDFIRHTPSWTVRGHWRYYKKTGKKVWINGYTKGVGKIEGKIYKV